LSTWIYRIAARGAGRLVGAGSCTRCVDLLMREPPPSDSAMVAEQTARVSSCWRLLERLPPRSGWRWSCSRLKGFLSTRSEVGLRPTPLSRLHHARAELLRWPSGGLRDRSTLLDVLATRRGRAAPRTDDARGVHLTRWRCGGRVGRLAYVEPEVRHPRWSGFAGGVACSTMPGRRCGDAVAAINRHRSAQRRLFAGTTAPDTTTAKQAAPGLIPDR